MSAYGAILPPTLVAPLEVLSYPLPSGITLSTHPIAATEAPRDLLEYLFRVFSDELEGPILTILLGKS